MALHTIKPAQLELLKSYLTDLQGTSNPYTDDWFYKRWASQIEQIHEITQALLQSLYQTNPKETHLVNAKISNRFRKDDFMVFQPHIDFLLAGIHTYFSELEMNLLQADLWEKPIKEMTGFELRTLILSTLDEHLTRQKSSFP